MVGGEKVKNVQVVCVELLEAQKKTHSRKQEMLKDMTQAKLVSKTLVMVRNNGQC